MKTSASTVLEPVTITPIGVVESPFESFEGGCNYSTESRIVLRSELAAGLVGIEYFSHLWVIYRQHRSAEWLHARGWGDSPPLVLPADDDRAGQGVFSSRAPCRPAGMGSCIVNLVRREENVLVVQGLDALRGTPVLDVKPYVPHFDAFPDAAVPLHWARVMDRAGDASRLSREFHWDTSNVDFALGLRVGVAALHLLNTTRSAQLRADIAGGAFFAHGFEMTTACSPLRGTLSLKTRALTQVPWTLSVSQGRRTVDFVLPRVVWPDAAGILAASDEALWTSNLECLSQETGADIAAE